MRKANPLEKTKKVRLNKWIAQASELSRRAADEAIVSGRVRINGEVVVVLGTVIDPNRDRVSLDKKVLRPPHRYIHLAFHKPRGYLVTKSDPKGRPTIWQLIEGFDVSLNSAGRLDYQSEGLLIITNDGMFLNKLTHPKHELWKRYAVKIRGTPDAQALSKLRKGVDLKEGRTAPARVNLTKGEKGASWLEIDIREGRYRQIRRMCERVGCPVIRLVRQAVGPVKLGRLGRGRWRRLSVREIKAIEEACTDTATDA